MSYEIEWIWPVAPLAALALLAVPFVGAMFAVVFVVLFAVAILVALAGAIVAIPLLLARVVRRRRRSGRALPAYTAEATVSRASLPTAARRQAAAPQAPAALLR
jgi:hypothetical protein